MRILTAVEMARRVLLDRVRTAALLLDATVGNGKDTLFLARESAASARIVGFDVQQEAIAAADALLAAHGLRGKADLILDDHARLAGHLPEVPVDAAMFNLGYRPGGPRDITTRPDSTVAAVKAVLARLSIGGLLSIVAYPGHASGCGEDDAVQSLVAGLPAGYFLAGCWRSLNQGNAPPVLYVIEKVRDARDENAASR